MMKIKDKRLTTLFKIFLGVIFFLQPLVVYLTAYDPGDCDDKAVHYYSAAIASTSQKSRNEFFQTIKPFIDNNSQSPSWQRTEFRLHAANNYPLANLLIAQFQSSKDHFTKAVNSGLLATTLVALIVIVAISTKTQFGFWQTTLVLNLIAFYSFKIHFLVDQVPRNMHPFIAYVPRGAGALMVIPIVLAFASKKWYLVILSLFLTFFWHVGLGIISLGLGIGAMVVYFLVAKYKLYKSNLIFVPLIAGIVGGINSAIAMLMLGVALYLFKNKVGINLKDFYHRAFLFGSILFLIVSLTIIYTSIPQVSLQLGVITGDPVFQELPVRLSGIAYTLLVLLTVIGVRIFGTYIFKQYLDFKKRPAYFSTSFFCILILSFLFLNHLPEYSWVARGASGFFLPTCGEVTAYKIPENLKSVTLGIEPDMFVSFANYIFVLNR